MINCTVEDLAKAFCEASGIYKWKDTPESMKEWYRAGIKAVLKQVPNTKN